jgi:transcriptional regulator GlxA family with amidase domain
MATSRTRSVGIYLFDGIEVLDFAGPYEVFTTATRVKQKQQPGAFPPFLVFTLAETLKPIKTRPGMEVIPQFTIDEHPEMDILIVPGGVVDEEMKNTRVLDWINESSRKIAVTASVCTGAFLLAAAGVLFDKAATTHWEDAKELQSQFPHVNVQPGKPWVDNGSIVTSGGIAAGIKMSLHLVARLESKQLATRTARQLEFEWKPEQPA